MSYGFVRRPGGPTGVLVAVFALASICEAGPAEDGDPVGTWKLSSVCPDGKSRDCVITVLRQDQSLKATYKADGRTRAARAVSFDRGILSITVDGDFAGSKYELTYRGKPAGNTLCGDVGWSYLWASGSFKFKGERIVVADEVATGFEARTEGSRPRTLGSIHPRHAGLLAYEPAAGR